MAMGSTSTISQLAPGEAVQGTAVPAPVQVFGNASLYVGDLDLGVGDEELFKIFGAAAPVVSVRVCRDHVSKTSLGYGYVNFNSQEDAVTAMEALNFHQINGKSIRVMFSHRDPNARKSNRANLFIKNLDPSIDSKTLFEIFSNFGTIISCKVNSDSNGQSLGYGFVQFEEEESAERAIESLNGMLVNNKKVYVGYFVRKQERELGNKTDVFTNVYVKNLPDDFSDENLRSEFGVFGGITSAIVMRDETGNSKCFGFVNFENADVAARAVEKLNGKVLGERILYVGRAQKKAEREKALRERFEQEKIRRREKMQGLNLFMKNLDESIDDANLRDLFSQFGEITSCKVMFDASGRSKGSGFVAFTTSEAAHKAINEMSGKIIGRKPLYVAFAQRKDERRAMLVAHFAQLNTAGSMMSAMPAGMQGYHHQIGLPPHIGIMSPHPLYFGPGNAGPGLVSPHAAPVPAYGFQPMRPPTPGVSPNFMMPYNVPPHQRQGRMGPRRGPPHQHQHQGFRYTQNGRSGTDRTFMNQNGTLNPVLPVRLDGTGGTSGMVRPDPIPMSALTTALAAASPDDQRLILGEQLYPLVEKIERDQVGKVTGMLLEMDQTEVLHLIESPDALRSKVAEAIAVLRISHDSSADQFGELSLNN